MDKKTLVMAIVLCCTEIIIAQEPNILALRFEDVNGLKLHCTICGRTMISTPPSGTVLLRWSDVNGCYEYTDNNVSPAYFFSPTPLQGMRPTNEPIDGYEYKPIGIKYTIQQGYPAGWIISAMNADESYGHSIYFYASAALSGWNDIVQNTIVRFDTEGIVCNDNAMHNRNFCYDGRVVVFFPKYVPDAASMATFVELVRMSFFTNDLNDTKTLSEHWCYDPNEIPMECP